MSITINQPSRLLLYIICLTLFLPASAQQCYWPNGDKADSTYKPCSNGTGACCYHADAGHRDLCFSNGFCYSQYFGTTYRGACTDSDWSAGSGCARQCKSTYPGDGEPVTSCWDKKMCCGAADNVTSCCADGAGFSWGNATFVNLLQEQVALSPNDASLPTTSVNLNYATTVVATVTVALDARGASQTLISSQECSNEKLALQAGLGIPLGLCFLALLGVLFVLYRRRDNSQRPLFRGSSSSIKSPLSSPEPMPRSDPALLSPSIESKQDQGVIPHHLPAELSAPQPRLYELDPRSV